MSETNFTATDEDIELYAKIYLEERNLFLNENPEDITKQDVEKLIWQMKMCSAVCIFLCEDYSISNTQQ